MCNDQYSEILHFLRTGRNSPRNFKTYIVPLKNIPEQCILWGKHLKFLKNRKFQRRPSSFIVGSIHFDRKLCLLPSVKFSDRSDDKCRPGRCSKTQKWSKIVQLQTSISPLFLNRSRRSLFYNTLRSTLNMSAKRHIEIFNGYGELSCQVGGGSNFPKFSKIRRKF
jgi:hypothetical protein